MVADESRPDVLSAPAGSRHRAIARVLTRVLLLNLAVASAKIVYGAWSGAVSILSDGLHSLTDSASNVAGLIGVRVAARPADTSHPYGHRKFETLASMAILFFLVLVLIEVVRAAVGRLISPQTPAVGIESFVVMGVTLAVNMLVVRYERRAAVRLRSEVLRADAHHTQSDVFTSLTVIAALVGVWFGWAILDPLAALLVAVFIGRAVYEIALETAGVLADSVVLDTVAVRDEVVAMPEVQGCHQIRTRGSADHVFLDLHVWFPPDMPLEEAHRRSHDVKDRLMARFLSVQDVVIHIEPPPTWRRAQV